MSQEVQVVKKRGRPKKTATETENVIVISTPATADLKARATETKAVGVSKPKPKSKSSASAAEKRSLRKTANGDGLQDESSTVKSTVKGARKSAKSQRDATGEIKGRASDILSQATAFSTLEQKKEKSFTSTESQAVSSGGVAVVEQLEHIPSQQPSHSTPSTDHKAVTARVTNLSNELRELSVSRVDVSLSRLSGNIKQSSDAVANLTTQLRRHRVNFDSRLADLDQRLHSLSKITQESASDVARLQHSRRNTRVQQIATKLHSLTKDLEQSRVATEHLKSTLSFPASIVHPTVKQIEAQLDTLTHSLHESTTTLQASNSTPRSSTLSATTPSNPASSVRQTMPSRPTPAPPTTTSNPSRTTPASSSPTSDLLRSRPRPSRPMPPPPTSNPNQPQPRTSPRQTEQHYEAIKRSPAFRRKYREWTGLMVGIPLVIVSSIVLIKRYQETVERNRIEAKIEERVRGVVPSEVDKAVRGRTEGQDG